MDIIKMTIKNFLCVASVLFFFANSALADCSDFDGASIIASDGKYIGEIASQYQSDSIFNEYGTYGSQYSSSSIWNQYGTYGSEYSSESPFNPYANSPPEIIKNQTIIGYLTVNSYKQNAINPIKLGVICYGITRTR